MKQVLCTVYGDTQENKGVAIISEDGSSWNLDYLPVAGKCNFALEYKGILYVPVQSDRNLILEYRRQDDSYILDGSYETEYFYSHGVIFHDSLVLASFSDGVDAVYDRQTHRETDLFIHKRQGCDCHGRSHYAGMTPDGKYVYAVDNALQQIYTYRIRNGRFELVNTLEFPDENIRLMPFSKYSGKAYLNTEKTNRIYILDYRNEKFFVRDVVEMENSGNSFSGANSVSEDGKHLCVSLRGEDVLLYYRIHADGSLELLSRVSCGAMPRDVLFEGNRIYVACTDQDAIEVYETDSETLKKVSEVRAVKPVTFACVQEEKNGIHTLSDKG